MRHRKVKGGRGWLSNLLNKSVNVNGVRRAAPSLLLIGFPKWIADTFIIYASNKSSSDAHQSNITPPFPKTIELAETKMDLFRNIRTNCCSPSAFQWSYFPLSKLFDRERINKTRINMRTNWWDPTPCRADQTVCGATPGACGGTQTACGGTPTACQGTPNACEGTPTACGEAPVPHEGTTF